MGNLFTIGTDTELFAHNKNNGQMISLCGKIGGSKDKPLQIKELPRGYCVQEDNVSLEFNIPPATSEFEFTESIAAMMMRVGLILKEMGLSVSAMASASFAKSELTHPNALIFGCEPDYSAWTMSENPKPACDDPTFRTAGGHVHVGTDANMIQAVKWMDLYLGVPSVIMDKSEGAAERRQLYGKAGAMRPKPYGFEYRVLSNFWVFKRELTNWVYNNTLHAVAHSKSDMPEELNDRIVNCINNSDTVEALKIVSKYRIPHFV
jgi:hypothetical protein